MRQAQKYGSGYDPKVKAARERPVQPPWGSCYSHAQRLTTALHEVMKGADVYDIFDDYHHVVSRVRVERIPGSAEFRWRAEVETYELQDVQDPTFGFIYRTTIKTKTTTVTATGAMLPIDEFTAKFTLLFGM